MSEVLTWSIDQFPVVYEHGEPKAILVDLATFKKIEFILDNLLNREPEPEDDIIAQSAELKRIIERVKAIAEPSPDWRKELDEL